MMVVGGLIEGTVFPRSVCVFVALCGEGDITIACTGNICRYLFCYGESYIIKQKIHLKIK